jgi:hypothetical protein
VVSESTSASQDKVEAYIRHATREIYRAEVKERVLDAWVVKR